MAKRKNAMKEMKRLYYVITHFLVESPQGTGLSQSSFQCNLRIDIDLIGLFLSQASHSVFVYNNIIG